MSCYFCASHISVVFWIGDLNYRISDLDVKDVKELISKKDFETLHNYDQVISQMVSSFSFLKSFISHICSQVQVLTSHMHSSSRGRSMKRLFLLDLWRERLISSPPINMTQAQTHGIQGNYSLTQQ